MKTTIIATQTLAIIMLVIALMLSANAKAQNSATFTSMESIDARGVEVINVDTLTGVDLNETKGSRILVEKTITIRGSFNNSEAVLNFLKAQGAFNNAVTVSVKEIDGMNGKVLKSVKPEKIYLNNGQTVEVFQSFKIYVPEHIKIENL